MLGGVGGGYNWRQEVVGLRRDDTLLALVWRRAFTLEVLGYYPSAV